MGNVLDFSLAPIPYESMKEEEEQHDKEKFCLVRIVSKENYAEMLRVGSPIPKEWEPETVWKIKASNKWPAGAQKIRLPIEKVEYFCGVYLGFVGVSRQLEGAVIVE